MIRRKELILENNNQNRKTNMQQLQDALDQLVKGKILIVLEAEDPDVVRLKKRYFAMITELGKYCGYSSYKDRELFKNQIKEELGGESIADMITKDQVRVKIEELHELAGKQYGYVFPQNDPDIISFT